ncbi:phage tail tube protein [Burkholderia cenocepacia]|uniref:phage tail tube protein n=1 Tax=Burkholderia cenocepacia TaxID=95486 RepID=UPI002AB77EEC|nr:phage tail tube protein [Burkholderia cenocepacia]
MGAPKSMRNSVVLAALQTAVGTPAVPKSATDAILVSNPSAKAISAEYTGRDLVRPYFGSSEQLPAGAHAELDFEVEVAGSGSAGVAPAWGRLLVACNFVETVTDKVDVKYRPVSTAVQTPLTLYYYLDGLLHKLTDARGTVSWDFTVKQIPKMKFHFMGVYNPVVDSPLPADTDFSKFLRPKLASTEATTWAMHGYTGPLQALSLDLANSLTWAALIGYEGAEINDRQPTGKITMQLGSVAEKNWWQSVKDATTGALTITQGNVPGNIVQFDAPKVQLTDPSYSDQDKKVMLDATLTVSPALGNDELVITVK